MADSVGGRDHLRLFVGLPLPADAVKRLVRWREAEIGAVPGVRLVPPENLHVTVAFLGGRPPGDVERVLGAVREASAAIEPPVLTPSRYRETRSVGMLVLADEGGRATLLADRVGKRLERLRVYRRERRPWLPHLTVVRFRERPRLAPSLPELGPVSLSEVALYDSVLRPGGSQYEVLESVALGGPVGA